MFSYRGYRNNSAKQRGLSEQQIGGVLPLFSYVILSCQSINVVYIFYDDKLRVNQV